MSDFASYLSEDEQYGKMLGNLLNPPDEPAAASQPVAAAAPPPNPIPTINPNDRRFAVPAGEPPNPTLKVRQPAPSASPAVPPKPAMPGAVAPNGKDPSFYQRAQAGALNAVDQSAQAASSLQNLPDPGTANTGLEAQRTTLAQPLNPQDPNYRPGVGTRIMRGVGALRKGGVLALGDPEAVGATPYGAPNKQFNIDTARRAAQVGSLDQQMQKNVDNYKAASERDKDIGTEARGVGAAYGNITRDATAQQNADTAGQTKEQLANQKALPQNDIELRVAAATDPDPVKRQQYQTALDGFIRTENKRFEYAARATGGGGDDDPRRQMIKDASDDIESLNSYRGITDSKGNLWLYDPAKNPQADPNDPDSAETLKGRLSPIEFTNEKNKRAQKLDKDLTSKKMRPLGARFNVKDTTQGGTPGATPQTTAPVSLPPQSVVDSAKVGQYLHGPGGISYQKKADGLYDTKTGKKVSE